MRLVALCLTLALLSLPLAGCARTRATQTREQLAALRAHRDQQFSVQAQEVHQHAVERVKREYDDFTAGRTTQAPAIDILIVSGGGDWGAFGAGFLKGWNTIKAGPNVMPTFDAVTGVSTGALIAPFAFLGDAQALDTIVNLYRNPKKDWVKQRWPLYFLPANESFAEVPGLEREMRSVLDLPAIQRIADASRDGRMLLVNTTDIDDGSMYVWDVAAEARRASTSGDPSRVHQILLASAGIPGAFPGREIDGTLYVDGGVTGNILYGARTIEDQSLPAVWKRMYPDAPMPKIRYWVIFNNQLRPPAEITSPTWPAVVGRSVSLAIRYATLTAIRHLFTQVEVSRLKRQADIELRIVAIPDEWFPPKPGVFIKESMNDLADLGEKMGADPASWRTTSP